MKITYDYLQATQDPTTAKAMPQHSGANVVLSCNIGDVKFNAEPMPAGKTADVPAKILRNGAVVATQLAVVGGAGAHEDWTLCRYSSQYTYTTRAIVGGLVCEKEMAAGAKVGDEGLMILYKGATTVADIGNGNWTERLIRPFIINANDIANRASAWPTSGTAPTIVSRAIVDNGGDGYAHV